MAGLPHVMVYMLGAVVAGGVLAVGSFVALSRMNRGAWKAELSRSGMYALVGLFGGGKSYFLAWIALYMRGRGRAVYANVHIAGCEYISDWEGFLAVPDGAAVLIDEAHLWAPLSARQLPGEVDTRLSQVRHHGIMVVWVTQSWTAVSYRLRSLTGRVWECRPLTGGGHEYTLYHASLYSPRRPSREARILACRLRRSRAVERSYDTLEDVQANLGWMDAERRRSAPLLFVVPAGRGSPGGPASDSRAGSGDGQADGRLGGG